MRDVSTSSGGTAAGAVTETGKKPLVMVRGRHRATARPAVTGAIEELSALARSGPVLDLLLSGGRDGGIADRLAVLSAAAAEEMAVIERALGDRRAWFARVLAELVALRREVRPIIVVEEGRLRLAREEIDRAKALCVRLAAEPERSGPTVRTEMLPVTAED